MARGDFHLFEEFADQLGSENHNLENGGDTIKLGLITNVATPLITATTPTWTDYSGNEVTPGGNYAAGGPTLANQSYTEVDGVATFDADNITIAQDAANFTDADWAILYNDTNGTKMAIGFIDLDGPVDGSLGPVNINWNASGIFTVTITP